MAIDSDLAAHLDSGTTTLCRCWRVERRDGTVFGFTDHDLALEFDGTRFEASEGLSARSLDQTTGLSVDNSEALGVLSDVAVTEADIMAGRFDSAEVRAWLVNWAAPEQRVLQFRGSIGEIQRGKGAFRAELRGLTEALNQPQGRVYQKPCTAILGGAGCTFDLSAPGFSVDVPVQGLTGQKFFEFSSLGAFADRWFERGRIRVLSGSASGLVAVIKNDRLKGGLRAIEVWEAVRGGLQTGDLVRLEAGCDKQAGTCRSKFANIDNFRGFPHIPGEDWQMSYPKSTGDNDGGSLLP